MELNALPVSLCRVPAFSISDNLELTWPALKSKIELSSPSFYDQIGSVEAHQIGNLPEKIQFTIWKYFNRSKYRATPFANFASYTLVSVGDANTALKIESALQSHSFINWHAKEALQHDLKAAYQEAEQLYSNTSIYQNDSEIRYLQFSEGTFELASIDAFAELKSIIHYCTTKRSKTAIYEFMKKEHEFNRKQYKNLMLQLLQLQILHSDKTPNIIGEDYFRRLKTPLQTHEKYILAERKLIDGELSRSKTNEVAEALQFLAQHLPKSQNVTLQSFKDAFIKKFEHQDISLALAMDPELGIGYGNLAQYEQADELIDQLMGLSSIAASITSSIHYTPLHQYLINGLLENGPIALENFASTSTKNLSSTQHLKRICHFFNDKSVIAHAGGCTANSLLGRFTLGSEALESFCKDIASIEQNANPDTLFFDIPYQAETHIDNVNRRKSCYPYELPILTWSCLAEPLNFSDVMVRLRDDEVILFSKKLGKRLIPRLASAYNYGRSDLAVYRFLCDLQHQSIQSNLSFDFQSFLPGLKHYPRVNYKKVILSPAKWLIPKIAVSTKK